jgi:hypothetical protein
MFYDGRPVFESDFMVDTETIASAAFALKTGGASSSVFAVKLGEGRLAGLTNGGIQVEDVGSALCISRLDGISSADVAA